MFGQGFLGSSAPFGADLNFLVQIGVGLLLLVGMVLARHGWYRAHGICQTCAFVVAATMAGLWMLPSLRAVFVPGFERGFGDRLNAVVIAHATLGSAVLLLGAWIILVAGTPIVPLRLRFRNYRAWMRTLLALWWTSIGLGLVTYRLAW